LLLASLTLLAAQATAPSPQPDPMTLGPAVGQTLPAFEVKDSKGVPRTFASLSGPEGLVLVFFRSADW
jgi:cytochrome oxidase Cu insertion factor (SCO1/SenC/PrrC family)